MMQGTFQEAGRKEVQASTVKQRPALVEVDVSNCLQHRATYTCTETSHGTPLVRGTFVFCILAKNCFRMKMCVHKAVLGKFQQPSPRPRRLGALLTSCLRWLFPEPPEKLTRRHLLISSFSTNEASFFLNRSPCENPVRIA